MKVLWKHNKHKCMQQVTYKMSGLMYVLLLHYKHYQSGSAYPYQGHREVSN